MQVIPIKQDCISQFNHLRWMSVLLLLTIAKASFAAPVINLHGQINIDKPVKYNDVILNMADGRFVVNAGGSLDIVNSVINLEISPENPYFVNLVEGNLALKHNKVNVTVNGLSVKANEKSTYQLINNQNGNLLLEDNFFKNDKAFSLQFLQSHDAQGRQMNINNNYIKNFHGGIYLLKSKNAIINANTFVNVSNENIFNNGISNSISKNIFLFPGNLTNGNAISVVDSTSINIIDNVIMSATKYGIYLRDCHKINVDNNKISDGSSFAIYIDELAIRVQSSSGQSHQLNINNDISISNNYLSQNKYGISARQIDHLTVSNNVFIQRFKNNKLRQYWTDNSILLPSVTNLIWSDNLYKEAFTQEVPGNNSNTLKFVIFPQTGGVVLT